MILITGIRPFKKNKVDLSSLVNQTLGVHTHPTGILEGLSNLINDRLSLIRQKKKVNSASSTRRTKSSQQSSPQERTWNQLENHRTDN